MKIPRRRFLGLAAGSAALMAVPRPAWRRAIPRGPSPWSCSPAPAARPTSSRGSSPRRCRNGSASRSSSTTGLAPAATSPCRRSPARRPTATRSCWSPRRTPSTSRCYEKQAVNLLRDIVPVASIDDDAFALLVTQSLPVKTRRRADRLCQGQSRQDQHDVERHRQPEPSRGRTVPDDDRHRDGPCAVSRHARGQHCAHHRRGARDVQRAAVGAAACEGRHRCARIGVTTKHARQACCRIFPPFPITVPDYAVTGWLGIGAPKGTSAEVVDRLNREMNAVLRIPRC